MPLRQLVIFTDPKRGRHPVPPRATWESGRVGQGRERELWAAASRPPWGREFYLNEI